MTIFNEDDLIRIQTISDAKDRLNWDEMRLALNFYVALSHRLMTEEAEFECPNCDCAVCKRIRGDKK